jgi:hypothetical protein
MFQLLQQKTEQKSSGEANRTVQMLAMRITIHVAFSNFHAEGPDTPEMKYMLTATSRRT